MAKAEHKAMSVFVFVYDCIAGMVKVAILFGLLWLLWHFLQLHRFGPEIFGG